jgi:hypothetical protein
VICAIFGENESLFTEFAEHVTDRSAFVLGNVPYESKLEMFGLCCNVFNAQLNKLILPQHGHRVGGLKELDQVMRDVVEANE